MDLEGRVDGRSKGGETIIMIYYVRKYFFNKRENSDYLCNILC